MTLQRGTRSIATLLLLANQAVAAPESSVQLLWTDRVSAIAALASAVFTLVGFMFLSWQVVQAKRALHCVAQAALYSQENAITKLFLECPQYRKYFYDNVECDVPEGDERTRILTIASQMSGFMEHIFLQRPHLPDRIRPAWVKYMRAMCRSSPLLREQLSVNRDWYGEEFLEMVGVPSDEPKW
jgi:hypothetical protein